MAELVPGAAAIGTIEERKDLGTGADATVRFWLGQLALAEAQDRDWIERGRKIVDRYRDDRRNVNDRMTSRYNILWSNVETLKPVLYGRTPDPDVDRRHKDQNDPLAALGAEIIERCLKWSDDMEEFDGVMQAVVEDRLLPGRGVARVFYEAEFGPPERDGPEPEGSEPEEEEGEDQQPVAPGGAALQGPAGGAGVGASPAGDDLRAALTPPVLRVSRRLNPEGAAGLAGRPIGSGGAFRPVIHERAPVQYVFWEDYRESPARTETEIWWKAYRSYLTRDQLVDRFGGLGREIELDYTPSGVGSEADGPLPDAFKKASVWEIWDKTKRGVVWIAKSHGKAPLDTKDDPLELPGFFPSPPALRATTTNDKRTPVADFVEYQDQADELDTLTGRIDRLIRALKVAGVYAGSEKATLQQLVDDGSENKLIPVEDWASFAGDKGGLEGMISWLPVEQIATVLMQLYDARERILRIIYQTTGIADILRGETDPVETLGAQQLKTQFATRRITKSQKDVARFARDLMRLRGAVIARQFSDDTLRRMSGLPDPLPAPPPAPPMLIPMPTSVFPPGLAAGMMPGGPGMGAPPRPLPAAVPGGPPMGPPPMGPPPMGPPPMGPPPMGPPPGAAAGPPPPIPGARRARDGRHYVPDPNRPGKYLMVA